VGCVGLVHVYTVYGDSLYNKTLGRTIRSISVPTLASHAAGLIRDRASLGRSGTPERKAPSSWPRWTVHEVALTYLVIIHFSRSLGRERSVAPLRYSAIPLTRPCIIVRIIVLLELVLPYSKAKMAQGTPKSRFSITDRRTDYHRDEQKKRTNKKSHWRRNQGALYRVRHDSSSHNRCRSSG
jgi:hypothetical protein